MGRVDVRAFSAAMVFLLALTRVEADPLPTSSAAPVPSPLASSLPKMFQLGGEADAGFTLTGANAGLQFTNTNNARVFDTVKNTPDLQNLYVTGALTAGSLGGEVDVSLGSDADVLHSYDQSTSGVDFTQAYLSYTHGALTLQAGKFFTLAGAEYARSSLDDEYSRSILFGYAIPFTHTGVRLTYAPSAKVSLIAGENLGWDQFRQTSGGATLEGGVLFNPSQEVNLSLQTYNGNENDTLLPVVSQAIGRRTLYDAVATLKATKSLTLTGNYDYASQTNASLLNGVGAPTGVNGVARWGGFAGYLNYAMTPKWSATLRGETFYDAGGYRTGFDQRWKEGTFTLQCQPQARLLFRAEYRDDISDQPVFARANAAGLSTLGTFGLETIVKF